MIVCDRPLSDTSSKIEFVHECENHYRTQIEELAKSLSRNREVRFLMLCGATCSGKTTTSHLLCDELQKEGRPAKTVSIDDFYRDRMEIQGAKTPDYESISAIDLPLFISCCSDILSGHSTRIPYFDFELGRRTGYTELHPADNELLIFEGIQAMYPEILSLLPKACVTTLYIGIHSPVLAYGTEIEAREIRFMRRLVRDYRSRNSGVSRTLSLWDSVIMNEEKNIFPNAARAEHTIDTFLPYEINVIGSFLLNPGMYDEKKDQEAALLSRYRSLFSNIPQIEESFVPRDSVFREFIG